MTTSKLLTAVSIAFVCAPAFADGDAAAGKAKFEANCEQCHFADDFTDEADSVLEAIILAISKDEIKHITDLSGLSDEDIVDLVAFFASQ